MAIANVAVRAAWVGGGTVGCKRDAAAAAFGVLPHAGRGFMRTVYMGARDTVYKVANNGGSRANISEYERMVRIANFDRNISTPCALFDVSMPDGTVRTVLAMTARPADATDADGKVRARYFDRVARYNAENPHGDFIGDMHDGNWRLTPRGRGTVTDCGDVFIREDAPAWDMRR